MGRRCRLVPRHQAVPRIGPNSLILRFQWQDLRQCRGRSADPITFKV
jgi:hypothetical protein